jgi:histidinol dehydrogenase
LSAPFAAQALHTLSHEARAALMERSESDISALDAYVRPFIAQVRAEGDSAVRALTLQFDKVDLGDRPLRATEAEFDAAEHALSRDVIDAIELACANIEKGHRDQVREPLLVTHIQSGVRIGERTLPLPSVGLYVPRGKGAFPSVVMMLAVPAVVAGVKRPVIVTPPMPDGGIDAATLVAARRAGVREVYRVGGIQAIAALAYGTASIPRVPKVAGPGNAYVTAAKRALASVLDPGVPAGPSESVVYADHSVDPMIAAHDLLIEAEHGPDSCAVLITPSQNYAQAVAARLPGLVDALPEPRRGFVRENFKSRSRILWTHTEDEAIAFINEFAPEHLALLTTACDRLHDQIENAGEVMLGPYAPITLGNFCAGTNAILPTGGRARSASCLGVPDFQKRMSFVAVNAEGFAQLASAAIALADYEGFPAHAAAVRYRLKDQT